MIKVAFVTGNKQKFEVAKSYFKNINSSKLDLYQKKIEVPEIQDKSVENIAIESAKWASNELGSPVIVSDVGLYIESLKGFPGPYVKHVNDWLNSEDFINLMKDHKNRNAYFIDSIAYSTPNGKTVVFSSITEGSIATTLRDSKSEWTVDNLFIPKGFEVPLALIPNELKNKVWNTDRWDKMAEYIKNQVDK